MIFTNHKYTIMCGYSNPICCYNFGWPEGQRNYDNKFVRYNKHYSNTAGTHVVIMGAEIITRRALKCALLDEIYGNKCQIYGNKMGKC